MDTGALIGVICGVVVTVVILLIIILVCLRKRGRLGGKSSNRTRRRGGNDRIPAGAVRETSLTSAQRPQRLSNGSLHRASLRNSAAGPDYLRQVSHTSGESHGTTTTPLVPTTPNSASLPDREEQPQPVSRVIITERRRSRPDAQTSAPQTSETLVGIDRPQYNTDWNAQSDMTTYMPTAYYPAASAGPNYNYAYNPNGGPVQYGGNVLMYPGYNMPVMPVMGVFGGYQPPHPMQPAFVPYAAGSHEFNSTISRNGNPPGRSWAAVPLMSTDLYLTRNNQSGELVVADLNEVAAAHLTDRDAELERSSVDYQHDLDGAASGCSSLARKSAAGANISVAVTSNNGTGRFSSPTHTRAVFTRSASHSLHSINRSTSNTPSILEEPEPVDFDVEPDYVNVSVHGRLNGEHLNADSSDAPPPIPYRNRNRSQPLSTQTTGVPQRTSQKATSPSHQQNDSRSPSDDWNDTLRESTLTDNNKLLPDQNDNTLNDKVARYDRNAGSRSEQQSILRKSSDGSRSQRSSSDSASNDGESRRGSKARKVFEVAL